MTTLTAKIVEFQLVDIKAIDLDENAMNRYGKEEIEALTQSFLEVDGNLKLPVIQSIGFQGYDEHYKVITGEREILAAKKANEINPQFEMMSVWLIQKKTSPEQIAKVVKQLVI